MNFDKLKDIANIRKIILYVAIAVVGAFLWHTWTKEHPEVPANQTTVTTPSATTPSAPGAFVPPSYTTPAASAPGAAAGAAPNTNQLGATPITNQGGLVEVKTDVLDVTIALQGGDLIQAELPKYNATLNSKEPIHILNPDPHALYIAQSGLKQNAAKQTENILYSATQSVYTLPDGEKNLTVQLTGKTASGVEVIKTYVFERNKYNIQMNYQLHNVGTAPWIGNMYNQIVRRNVPPAKGDQHSRSYVGAAISSPDRPYEKLPYKKLSEIQVDRNIQGGWIAMQQAYFLSAWIPATNQLNHYYSSVTDNVYTLGYVGPQINLAPGATSSEQSVFYVGPEITDYLKPLAKGLDLTIDYGWLWMISKAIFWVMDHIHNVVGNWGWSIIITTLVIKLLFYKLSEKSYRSMAKMREIQPRLAALKERYGDDKAAFSKATMEFYKKEKINPLGGCLPTIIQIPVFIGLYYVLIESVQLRQAPFIFWIKDLSVHDPYYVLPILMGASMFLQQRLSPPPPDPTQAKMMMFLPVIFTVFFLSFPAGLVLYWLVNNCASVLQQWYIMKSYHPPKATPQKAKNKSKIKA